MHSGISLYCAHRILDTTLFIVLFPLYTLHFTCLLLGCTVYAAVNPLLNTLTECPNVPRELFYSKEMPILVEQGPYTFREVEKKVKQPEQGTRLGYGRPCPE